VEVCRALRWGQTFHGGSAALAAVIRAVLADAPAQGVREVVVRALERYSWPGLAETYLALYERLVTAARLP
jgi:hypothetical protein